MADVQNIIAPMGVSSTPTIQTSAGVALAANKVRGGFIIQNLGTNPLFVLLGVGASTTVFTVVLKGGTAADDGLGASYSEYIGAVYVGAISVAGTSPRFVITEKTQ